ncbi:Dps family protein [Spirochaeta africana]|uniref:DNA-binding ferritin-like protein (Oxidative damage protectant) n=1 Tax=Spirochaeta africana (strain ATCC 700263 / DSM 8902 / Z-7692) TaxID=889378 RepID=H9UFQ5_SPIAZ|nr:DNA starvation/stationary phase protection protein [Spirochaeta africana]AFG36348.1 DNA-binding ferritin-like protein (oxidative damage protectant) [Spirochaeta africana DSM 8902]
MDIGLENKETAAVAKALNQYLADLRTLHAKVQNYHWNLIGASFFTLHEKYEEFYDFLAEQIDEVAERVLSLGQRPLASLKDFLATTKVAEAPSTPINGPDSAKSVLADFEYIIKLLRESIEVAEDNSDPGTADMLTASIETYEKNSWMLRAYLAQ